MTAEVMEVIRLFIFVVLGLNPWMWRLQGIQSVGSEEFSFYIYFVYW